MTTMRALLAAFTLVVLALFDGRPASAEICRPWCVHYAGRDGGGTNCGFISLEQCKQTAQGTDMCAPNGFCPPQNGQGDWRSYNSREQPERRRR
jgi:Protein of unknown function (DUF3551)